MTKRTKIALIGPVAPYRGGISQYTTQLHHVLANYTTLHTISFKRQYPRFLYPGKSDIDERAAKHREKNVTYILDAYSPLSLWRTVRHISHSDCEVAIISWWTLFWQPGFAFIARRLRKRGIKTVFLCHNLVDHDTSGLKRRLSEWFLKQADGYIVHSSEEAKALEQLKPGTKILMRPHPIYTHFPAPNKTLAQRGRLELLFFGFIRPYKGLDVLLEALAQLDDKEVHLTIVGETWDNEQVLRSRLAAIPNVEAHLKYVSEQEAANYFARADVVVLPYLSATGSGVVTLAYNYQKPVIASRVGGLQDAVIEDKTGWLVPPDSPADLAAAIKNIDRKQLQSMKPAIKKFCQENSWDAMAEKIATFTRHTVGRTD